MLGSFYHSRNYLSLSAILYQSDQEMRYGCHYLSFSILTFQSIKKICLNSFVGENLFFFHSAISFSQTQYCRPVIILFHSKCSDVVHSLVPPVQTFTVSNMSSYFHKFKSPLQTPAWELLSALQIKGQLSFLIYLLSPSLPFISQASIHHNHSPIVILYLE